jgi:hypothetical protein
VWAGQAAQHGRHRRAAAQSGRRSPRTYCTQGDKVNAGGRSTAQQHVQEVRQPTGMLAGVRHTVMASQTG